MPAESLKSFVQALLDQLPAESSPLVIVVKPDRPSPTTIRTNGHRSTSQGLLYDPSVVYILELATIIALRDQETVAAVGQAVADALQNVVRDSINVHPLVVSRAVFYLFHVLHASQVSTTYDLRPENEMLIAKRHMRLSVHPSYSIQYQVSISQPWRDQHH